MLQGCIVLYLFVSKEYCTMLYLFDDIWLDKIIPKNNDRTKKAEPYMEILRIRLMGDFTKSGNFLSQKDFSVTITPNCNFWVVFTNLWSVQTWQKVFPI